MRNSIRPHLFEIRRVAGVALNVGLELSYAHRLGGDRGVFELDARIDLDNAGLDGADFRSDGLQFRLDRRDDER